MLGPQLLDRAALVLVGVDVLLVQQDDLLEPLAQPALGDLLAHLRRLALVGLLLEIASSRSRSSSGTSSSDTQRGAAEATCTRDLAGELEELLVAGDEVGLAVDLDERARRGR